MKKYPLSGLIALLMLSATIAAPAHAGTTVSGKFTLQLTVSVLPGIPASTPINCTLQADVSGISTTLPPVLLDQISDSSVVAATRTGSQAKCSVVLPYKWTLAGSNDTVTLTYLVNATTSTGIGRRISVFITTIPVPASGATTAETETGAI